MKSTHGSWVFLFVVPSCCQPVKRRQTMLTPSALRLHQQSFVLLLSMLSYPAALYKSITTFTHKLCNPDNDFTYLIYDPTLHLIPVDGAEGAASEARRKLPSETRDCAAETIKFIFYLFSITLILTFCTGSRTLLLSA